MKEALDNKGVTNEIKSRLRAEVFSILEDNTFEKPRVSQENLLINELIREYMDFNHYKYSKSVFLNKLTRQVPLIYSLLWNSLNEDPCPEIDLTSKSNSNSKQSSKSNNQGTSKNINIFKYNPEDCDPDHKI